MGTGIIKKVFPLVSGLLILTFTILGCIQNSTSKAQENDIVTPYQKDKSHWFVDENGHFHTDNVTLAQKKIPFTIVVPSYIPDVFVTNYQYEIIGPFKNILPNNIEVEIQYWDNRHQIYISEYNIKEIMLPNQEFKPIYYSIAGIQVLKQITGFTTSSGRIEGLGFYWNINNLTFKVEIFNIPEEEGIKIVESMIKQMKS